MEEVQSWWQVPAIAHFCYAFRTPFDLFHVDIEEFEAAILNMQDPDICVSLEQITIRILQGCFNKGDVTSENWEEKLQELFEDCCEDDINPLENTHFTSLTPRLKVETLFKLCEFRLDMNGAFEEIKDVPAEDMQATCIGQDSNKNFYWYFYDERLYKENPEAAKNNKQDAQEKSSKAVSLKKRARFSARMMEKKTADTAWSIACHNMNDWNTLVEQFCKINQLQEKKIVKQIEDKFMPMLTNVVAKKEQRLKKRLLELAPIRSSARISVVKQKRKLEEQMAAAIAEKHRIKLEEKKAKEDARKEQEKKESRSKRAEERDKKNAERALERARRFEQRQMKNLGWYDSDSNSKDYTETFRAKKAWHMYTQSQQASTIPKKEKSSSGEESSHDSGREIKPFSAKKSKTYEKVSTDEDSLNDVPKSLSFPTLQTVDKSSVPNNTSVMTYSRPSVIQNARNYSIWNTNSGQPNLMLQHQLAKPLDSNPGEVTTTKETKPVQIPDNKVVYYMDNSSSHPFRLNTFSKQSSPSFASSASVIRINIIKSPTTKHQVVPNCFSPTSYNKDLP